MPVSKKPPHAHNKLLPLIRPIRFKGRWAWECSFIPHRRGFITGTSTTPEGAYDAWYASNQLKLQGSYFGRHYWHKLRAAGLKTVQHPIILSKNVRFSNSPAIVPNGNFATSHQREP